MNGGNERNVILTDLNEFTNYDVAIKAATSVGAGPHGGIKSETTFEDGKYQITCIGNGLYQGVNVYINASK